MSEFLHYILWELRRYSVLALLVGFLALGGFSLYRVSFKRKFGNEREFPWKRILLYVVFIGYLALVFFVTNFRTSGMGRQVNLHLFRAWREALNNFTQHRWLNVLLNIAMFGPFGFWLPLFGRKFQKWYVTIPTGFGFSLCLEVLQYLFQRGVFDVDDLFCNTLGGMIGYFLVMAFLAIGYGKRKRWKPFLGYACLTLIAVGGIGSVFLAYHVQEFGNLPQAHAYRVDTGKTFWMLECELPSSPEKVPVYRNQTRNNSDCDAFAEVFRQIIPTEFEDISYYQEAAYYMDHGNGDGAHFLFVNYLDQGYEYTAIYDDEPVWADSDRETLLKALEKYPVTIPAGAEFEVLGDGWHCFSAKQIVDGEHLYDGTLRVRIDDSGTIREIENNLLCYTYFRDAQVISPEEALKRIRQGYFNDEGYFEHKLPAEVSLVSCGLEYRVDTKGFYQPVYVFEATAPDGSYHYRIVIPALQ